MVQYRSKQGAIMLITFQSPATPDVVMLRDLAQYLLGLVGKRLDTRGVILHVALPRPISRLEAPICHRADAGQLESLVASECLPENRPIPPIQGSTLTYDL